MSPSTSEREIQFMSSDGKEFTIKESIAVQFGTIKQILDEDCVVENVIPLPNVDGNIFGMINEYCTKHADGNISEEDLNKFDLEFAKKDLDVLIRLVLASDYLNIKGLFEFMCQKIADEIKELMPEKVREIFKIENDFTPEEEAAIRKKHEWAFEPGPGL